MSDDEEKDEEKDEVPFEVREGPRITRSRLLQAWHQTTKYGWDETSSLCDKCRRVYTTGDVVIIFGDITTKAFKAIKYKCVPCGYAAILAGVKPSGGAVFVEKAHAALTVEELPKELADKVIEALAILDAIATGLEDAAQAPGTSEILKKGAN